MSERNWKAADSETENLILDIIDRELHGYFLSPKDIDNIPLDSLRIIDKLWMKHSNGIFGFSIQKKIYREVSNSFEKYVQKVEDKSTCKGHFPRCMRVLGSVKTKTNSRMIGGVTSNTTHTETEIVYVFNEKLLKSLLSLF